MFIIDFKRVLTVKTRDEYKITGIDIFFTLASIFFFFHLEFPLFQAESINIKA